MLGEIKVEIMTQVDVAIKSQLFSVINEIKCQMKGMFKEMVKEMTSSSNEIPSTVNNVERNSDDISYENEKDDEEMEIISSDEELVLYTDQVTTLDRISLSAHKKKISSKGKNNSTRRINRAKWLSSHTTQQHLSQN